MSNTLKYINISLESWGVLVCVAAIAILFIESKIDKRTRNHFLSLFGCLLADLWCNMVGILTKGLTSTQGQILVRAANFGEFFFGFLLSFFFSVYILSILGGRENKKLRVWYILATAILVLGELLVIVSSFTGWLYYIDANAMYHRGSLYWLSSALAAVSLLANAAAIFTHRGRLRPAEWTALRIYIWTMVIADIATLLFYGIYFILLASVLVAFMMLTVLVNEQIELTRKSVKNKINYLLAASMITLTLFLLAFITILSLNMSSENAQTMKRESTNVLSLRLDNQLALVEQAVNDIYVVSEKYRPVINELEEEDTVIRYSAQMEEIAISIANHTNGAVAVYYRMNPELTNSGTFGFFSVKSPETGLFEHHAPTDLSAYDSGDMEHVGWYYLPVQAGEPVWMEPYYNANIDIYMVSYAMPVYDNGDLVGVIGMDIDFTAFEEIAGSFQVYSSSGSVLCSQDFGKIYYQKDAFFGDSIEDEIASIPPDGEQAEQLRFMKVGREKYAAYFKTLDNQMQLVTYVSASETNKQVYYIVVVGFAVFCLIFLGSLQLSLGVSKKITKPLYDIMEATTQYANGNWNAKVSCETDDEIGMLANNIGMMADKTRDYISQIRYMAKYDALTGVRNRNDYQQHVERYVEEALHSDGKLALVVMDVNNLKTANDSLGHETGDALLRSAGKLICEAFSPSPVYRIGGDEFAVIVHGADCDTVDQKLRVFQEQVNSVAAIGNITDVCVASGMAKLGIDGDTYDAVFKAADERMYRDKASLKAKKEGRLGKA